MQMPTIGRIVHFNSARGLEGEVEQQAALVIAVHGPRCVSLVVWNSAGTSSTRTSVELGTSGGSWQWPEIKKAAPPETPAAA